MAADRIRALIEKHQVFYEILPYYILLDERPPGERSTQKRIRAGFDINLYAATVETPLRNANGNEEFHGALEDLQQVADEIVSEANGFGEIEITPFENSVILDTHRNLQPEALLRIRITHDRGLSQAERSTEEQILSKIRQKLRQLGVREGTS